MWIKISLSIWPKVIVDSCICFNFVTKLYLKEFLSTEQVGFPNHKGSCDLIGLSLVVRDPTNQHRFL